MCNKGKKKKSVSQFASLVMRLEQNLSQEKRLGGGLWSQIGSTEADLSLQRKRG